MKEILINNDVAYSVVRTMPLTILNSKTQRQETIIEMWKQILVVSTALIASDKIYFCRIIPLAEYEII
jgi:hypothetical protein